MSSHTGLEETVSFPLFILSVEHMLAFYELIFFKMKNEVDTLSCPVYSSVQAIHFSCEKQVELDYSCGDFLTVPTIWSFGRTPGVHLHLVTLNWRRHYPCDGKLSNWSSIESLVVQHPAILFKHVLMCVIPILLSTISFSDIFSSTCHRMVAWLAWAAWHWRAAGGTQPTDMRGGPDAPR